ncbi:MAG: MFS transporter [Candidatus Marinimicrobia bacterium]|nr:MFS transporter [Candidatus Neomarinimicrobiota bacterium]
MADNYRKSSGSPVAWNFACNTMDGAMYSFGMSFLSLLIVLPVFVKKLGGNEIAIGLIPVLWALGFNLPQLLIAPVVRNLVRKKPLVLKTAFLQRLPWLLLAIMTLFLGSGISPTMGLVGFFSLFFLAALTGGINLPGWFDLVSKLTLVNVRGRLFALRSTIGALLGILGGWLVHLILEQLMFPWNFALIFFIGYGVLLVSFFFITLLKEEDSNDLPPIVPGWRRMVAARKIFSNDRNFVYFLVADSLMVIALMGNAFITVFALEKFARPASEIGLYTMVMMASMIAGSLAFGFLGDHFGHRLNLTAAGVLTTISAVVAVLAANINIFLIVFVLSAMTIGIIQVSRLTIVAEFSPSGERASYVAVAHLVALPFAFSGIIAGWIAAAWSYEVLFIVVGIFAFLSALVWIFAVREPRLLPARTIPAKPFET